MPLSELAKIPDGFVLVKGGRCESTRRDPEYPRGFRGVSADDAALLHAFLAREGSSVTELHTDVVCGCVPDAEAAGLSEWYADLIARVHPLRIDAVAKISGVWWLLECKPDAGYVALGQVLCYGYYAEICELGLGFFRMGVITNKVQACVAPVFEMYGVEVFQVGDVISDR